MDLKIFLSAILLLILITTTIIININNFMNDVEDKNCCSCSVKLN